MKTLSLALLVFLNCSSLSAQVQKDTTFIYFPFDSYQLTGESEQELQNFLEGFQNKPAHLTIYGHCDSKGSHEYNDLLSVKRTAAVKQWLEENGVSAELISVSKGFGKRKPVNDNSTEEERSLNRRVEIIFDIMEERPSVTDTVKTFSKKTMETIKEGERLVLPHINFQGGLHRFMPSSLPHLEELLGVMKSNPTLEIEIQGHICCRPGTEVDGIDLETSQYNLSESRAKAVYEYLIENGIEKERMRYKGLAGKFPIVFPERTEEDRTKNRRVEILVLRK